jgi:biopolymer transport protein TolQ
MSWKVWVMSGILLMLAGMFGTVWGIYRSFQSLATEQTAGIGAVGDAIGFALICCLGGIAAMIPLIIGLVKLYKSTK